MTYATHHFCLRVAERVGPIDPHALAAELTLAVETRDDARVEFAGRGSKGSRLYRFLVPQRGEFFALRAAAGHWITVMIPGHTLKRGRKRSKRLNARHSIQEESYDDR